MKIDTVVTKENIDEVIVGSGFHTKGEIYKTESPK